MSDDPIRVEWNPREVSNPINPPFTLAGLQAEAQQPCHCGQPIRTVTIETSRGITEVGQPMQVPKMTECVAGHITEEWIDWPPDLNLLR